MKHSPRSRPGRPAAWAISVLLPPIAIGVACKRQADPAPAAAVPPAAAPAPAATPAVIVVPEQYGFRPAERRAVEGFLRRHADLRLPSDADRRASTSGEGDVKHLYGVYHPYFVRGDLNDDGLLDFVIGFVRRDSSASTPWFTVAVFSGREDGSFGPEVFLERDISLAAGDLSIDRDAVVITPDLDDEATRRYRWDPSRRSYIFVRDDEPESDPPDLSRT
jgi:hypothetical protein